MSVPIYTGGALRAQIEIATAQQAQAMARYGSVALRAFYEVEIALTNEALLAERLRFDEQGLADRTAAVRIARLRYVAGAMDMLSMLQLQERELIGRRPVAAFGNSIGDRQMLEYTQAGDGARLMMLVHHDDATREYAYGPKSKVGTFPDALMAQAKKQGWVVISMKNDWKRIFGFEEK